MTNWLIKSDPDAYSWADMVRDKVTNWSGVRNFQARNNLNSMRKGEKCLFYHSGEDKAVVGIVEVVKGAYHDDTDKSGKFVMVDVKYVKAIKHVTLEMIKKEKSLKDFALVKQSRLSVMPVSDSEWKTIMELSK